MRHLWEYVRFHAVQIKYARCQFPPHAKRSHASRSFRDGSACGGVVVALAESFGIPGHAVVVGEPVGDLRPFDAAEFAKWLVGA